MDLGGNLDEQDPTRMDCSRINQATPRRASISHSSFAMKQASLGLSNSEFCQDLPFSNRV